MYKYVKKLINIIYGTKFREGIYTYNIRETSKVNGFNPFRCQDKALKAERIEGLVKRSFSWLSRLRKIRRVRLSKTIKYVNIIVSIHNLAGSVKSLYLWNKMTPFCKIYDMKILIEKEYFYAGS